MSDTVQKVCPVVLRETTGRRQLLVFRHPLAGTQLVKGMLEAGERPEEALLRELAEESGIERAEVVDKLGEMDLDAAYQRWHLYLCRPTEALPEARDFFTADGGLTFHFFWRDLDAEPEGSWHESFVKALEIVQAWGGADRS